ncbi:hypothetical protein B0H14DRAFT_3899235 [Mycena olivaceomarginata]|nr:hypothetical protein B0H14DRAFT_3899235 [Mycena olivaceomarginata]
MAPRFRPNHRPNRQEHNSTVWSPGAFPTTIREQARLDKDAKQRAIRKAKKNATDWDGSEEEEEESELESSSEKEHSRRVLEDLPTCHNRHPRMPERAPAGTSPKVYTTIELVVMPVACRRNDLSLRSTSTLPTTPDVAARRASVSPCSILRLTPSSFHIERTPACSLLHRRLCPASGCSMPTLATLVHCTSRSAPHTRSPAPLPLGPAAPPNCSKYERRIHRAVPPGSRAWDASDSGGFGSVVNAN